MHDELKSIRVLYDEKGVSVRQSSYIPDVYHVWIKKFYFLFRKIELDRFAGREDSGNGLEKDLKNTYYHILFALEQKNISPKEFCSILAEAKENEKQILEGRLDPKNI